MTCTAHGPLQDPMQLTPFALLFFGIIIEEPVPNYFCFRTRQDDKQWALHDTPEQAIYHARWAFRIWGEE